MGRLKQENKKLSRLLNECNKPRYTEWERSMGFLITLGTLRCS